MLDAAHGERIGALAVVQRLHRSGVEPQVPCLLIAGKERRRSPVPTVRADAPQGSRRRVAVACSRRCKAIAQRNPAEGAEQWFTAIVVASFFGSFEPCGPQPWPAEARKHPAVARRAPQATSESQVLLVILSGAKNLFPCEPKAACGLFRARRRKTNEVQSNICIVSIQILRRSAPQNDELLLNCALISLRELDFTPAR